MDILSFVLGICCVVVAGMLAGTVYLLLSVRRMNIEFKDHSNSFRSDVIELFNRSNEQSSRLDSRFDKCMNSIRALEANYRGLSYDKILERTPKDWTKDDLHPHRWVHNPGPTCSTENSIETN